MKWIGLTGGVASGKTTASKILRSLGYQVIDADELARNVVQPSHPAALALRAHLGEEFFQQDGRLDRKKLADSIFSDSRAREQVESILHPWIQKEAEQEKNRCEKQGEEIAFYDVPLLFEKGLEDRFDSTWLIYTSENIQRSRISKRENWSTKEVEARLRSQWPLERKKKLADYVIDNSGSMEDLKSNLIELLAHYKSVRK